MNKSNLNVLNYLRKRTKKGVCITDGLFLAGFALRSRVSDLRHMGFFIIGQKDKNSNCYRYWLKKEPDWAKNLK